MNIEIPLPDEQDSFELNVQVIENDADPLPVGCATATCNGGATLGDTSCTCLRQLCCV